MRLSPLDTPDDYPNIDEVKQFIEVNYLDDQAPLQQKIAKVGKLHLDKGLGAAKQPVLHAVNQLLMKSDISDWDGFVSTLDQSSLLAINYSPLPPTQTILKDREEKIASLLKDLNHQFFQNEGSASQVFYRRIKSNWKNLSAESTKLVSGAKLRIGSKQAG